MNTWINTYISMVIKSGCVDSGKPEKVFTFFNVPQNTRKNNIENLTIHIPLYNNKLYLGGIFLGGAK